MLPTKLDVMKTFCYYHKGLKKTISESAAITSEKLIVVWNKARIPPSFKTFIIFLIKKIFIDYLKLKKNKNTKKLFQNKKVEKFSTDMILSFDIAHTNAKDLIKIEEDTIFLINQSCERKIAIGSEDTALAKL